MIRKRFDVTVQNLLGHGGVAVIPTDTIYGISASTHYPEAIERIYTIRRRNSKKPFIVLINSITDLKFFGVRLNPKIQNFLRRYWPGEVSVILRTPKKKWGYLHRGTGVIAFRVPRDRTLRNLLKETGPLVTTSVNPEGKEPAKNIREAQAYFGTNIDCYVDRGRLDDMPSTLVRYTGKQPKIIRQGRIAVGKW